MGHPRNDGMAGGISTILKRLNSSSQKIAITIISDMSELQFFIGMRDLSLSLLKLLLLLAPINLTRQLI